MIFLTVGNELPFDRLVRAVDLWCGKKGRKNVFGQVADIGEEGYKPENFEWQEFVSPTEYQSKYDEAELVIGHAGMGTIITAMVKAKPILIMPRRAAFRETRNDHQMATVQQFVKYPGLLVAENELQVGTMLDKWEARHEQVVMKSIGPYAEGRLIKTIRDFIIAGG